MTKESMQELLTMWDQADREAQELLISILPLFNNEDFCKEINRCKTRAEIRACANKYL